MRHPIRTPILAVALLAAGLILTGWATSQHTPYRASPTTTVDDWDQTVHAFLTSPPTTQAANRSQPTISK